MTQNPTSLTQRLIHLIAEKQITDADREAAALYVLDVIGNILGAVRTEPGRMVRAWFNSSGKDAGRQAFLMGALAHTLEIDDLHRASVTHPGCVVVPAAWAVASRNGASSIDFLNAVIVGYEAMCRIGMSVGPAHYETWHNTATCGPFGSAMATAHLLGLDENQTCNALGNAGTQSSGLWEFLPAGAMSKHLHAGRAAESGIIAADLAALGFTGPATILEGPKGFYKALCPDPQPESLLGAADLPWQIHATSLKPWPSCRHTHPAIDAALAVSRQIDASQIEQVIVETYATAINVCDRPLPRTDYDAKFSLQHCVAMALRDDEIDFSSFDEKARDEAANLRDKIELVVSDHYNQDYPYTWGAAVTAVQKDGVSVDVHRHFARGDPQDPLSEQDITEKVKKLMAYGGAKKAPQIISTMLALTAGGPMPVLPIPQ